jgi:hypothetical protein
VICPEPATVLGSTKLTLPDGTADAEFCGTATVTLSQSPPTGTALALNSVTNVTITATDTSSNAELASCSYSVLVPPVALLYQTTFQIRGKSRADKFQDFRVPNAENGGLIHSVTGRLNKNLYYYSEVVRSVLSTLSPIPAVHGPRMLIQWRRNEAGLDYGSDIEKNGDLVPFTNETLFRLAMSSNYIEFARTATYRVYGQRA